jgi:Domain of unknown function (DUF4384)
MTACPSWLELAQLESGSGSEAVRGHVKDCPRCLRLVSDIANGRSELLGPDPERASVRAARTLLRAAGERVGAPRSWFRQTLPALAAPAAGVLLVGFALLSLRDLAPRRPIPDTPITEGSIRTKGGLDVRAFCKRGDDVFPVVGGEKFLAGDRLRFSYTTQQAGYLTIFGVNGDGRVFPYYPEDRLDGLPVAAGVQQTLPGSVELDRYQGREQVFALWSPEPLDESAVRRAVADALTEAGGDLSRVKRLPLPAEQTSYLLYRR